MTPLGQMIAHLLQRVRRTIERERRFTDDDAHELRTPLTAVKTHLQVIRLAVQREDTGAALDKSLDHAGEGVMRMQRTLEQLLRLARLDAGAGVQEASGANAFAAASRAVQEAEAGQNGGVRVTVVGTDFSDSIAMPEVLLVSAIHNLIDNALRFSPVNSTVTLKIDRADEARIRFTVLDKGEGLSEADCARATDRFWRRTQSPEGSGLGLSIVSAIAERYGGGVELHRRDDGRFAAVLIILAHSGTLRACKPLH